MKRVCVLGSNSGRNAGDAAILSSIIRNMRKLKPDTQFDVPTTHADYLYRKFGRDGIRAVSMMPWSGSIRIAGIPTVLSILRSDVVIITDGIIFDVKLWNPLFNFLLLLVPLVPFVKLFRKKLVCFLVGVGPLDTAWGKRFARYVCNACDVVMAREKETADLVRSIGVDDRRIETYADAAFVNPPADAARAKQILVDKGVDVHRRIVALNINSYVDQWLQGHEKVTDPIAFQQKLAASADRISDELDCSIVMVGTQIMDAAYMREVVERMQRKERAVIISNEEYSSEEVMAVLGQATIFAGMRLHSIILAASMGTPCIGLAYAPKVRSHMELLGLKEFTVELKSFDVETFTGTVRSAFEREEALREALSERIQQIKGDAMRGYEAFADRYL